MKVRADISRRRGLVLVFVEGSTPLGINAPDPSLIVHIGSRTTKNAPKSGRSAEHQSADGPRGYDVVYRCHSIAGDQGLL